MNLIMSITTHPATTSRHQNNRPNSRNLHRRNRNSMTRRPFNRIRHIPRPNTLRIRTKTMIGTNTPGRQSRGRHLHSSTRHQATTRRRNLPTNRQHKHISPLPPSRHMRTRRNSLRRIINSQHPRRQTRQIPNIRRLTSRRRHTMRRRLQRHRMNSRRRQIPIQRLLPTEINPRNRRPKRNHSRRRHSRNRNNRGHNRSTISMRLTTITIILSHPRSLQRRRHIRHTANRRRMRNIQCRYNGTRRLSLTNQITRNRNRRGNPSRTRRTQSRNTQNRRNNNIRRPASATYKNFTTFITRSYSFYLQHAYQVHDTITTADAAPSAVAVVRPVVPESIASAAVHIIYPAK